ncbi:MAG: glutathione S-transferase N-terminal domain-containing protein [Hyphomicrobiaceae bacterium]|nr:glutathione S-transferase N-terminal domain-containing protein [Hyphomicrobiaceae bacterium]
MLKVWGRRTSINVQKVMFAVGELGLPHERFDVGGPFGKLDTPEYTMLNPNRLVPTIDDGGFVLWESNAIVRHLAQRYGRGTLSPADELTYAKADQWMEWAQSSLYGDIISTCFLQLVRTPARLRDKAAVDAAEKRAGEKLAILDRQLSGRAFIVGEQPTIADVAVGALMYRYFNLPMRRPSLAKVEGWYERLTRRPAYQTHVMIEFESMKVEGA